ncbi:hypothetical protein ACFZDP_43645 [Streptomyces mirabilis]|uniref:hypothetical protein n=1 Tax=Streptomyces mirabilis TaxID=68239 RepID=UPI0036EDBAD8
MRRRVSARRPRASGGDECDPHDAFAGQEGVGLCGGGTDGTLSLLTGLHIGGVGFTAELPAGVGGDEAAAVEPALPGPARLLKQTSRAAASWHDFATSRVG